MPSRRRPRRWLRKIIVLLFLLVAAIVAWEALTWPDVAALARRNPPTTAFIERYRARQRAAGRDDRVQRVWVAHAAIASSIKRAVLVGEDINFFSHRGFDFGEIRLAVTKAVEDGAPLRGASTITQQLAKNLWLTPSRSPLRKIEEAILTWQLERTLPKRRILELYLNVVEFGPGVYGVEAASRRYFAKPASQVTDDEAAELAASLPSPASWHPGSSRPGYRRHVDSIKRRMAKATFLKSSLAAVADESL
jgi:monofunctional biosynthetic peptidoglycan transglycosylase